MEFQEILLKVAKALSREETEALAFLCRDLNQRKAESPMDLFKHLMDKGFLSEDEPDLLFDLLDVIERHHLLRDSNLSSKRTTTSSPISSYRKLLYVLSEDIPEKDLEDIKFLLSSELQRSALEPHRSTLEVFLAMERKELLSSSDLSLLQKLLKSVCPVLLKHIQQFEDSQDKQTPHWKGPISQENGSNFYRLSSSLKLPDPDLPQLSSLQLSNTPTENESHMHAVGSNEACTSNEPKSLESGRQHRHTIEDKEEVQPALAAYPMTSRQRGVCWIVNNFNFSSSQARHSNREGTHIDEDSLSKVFTWLGFKVEVVQDATGEQMRSSMRELSWRDHSDMDCVVCCILSHGLEGGVYGVDGEVVDLTELSDLLSGLRCPSLREKPKLFFIQACQGTQEQQAVSIQTDGPGSHGDICIDAEVPSERFCCREDFLTAMATVPSYVSLRDKKLGSWFIQSLCQSLVQMVPHGHDLGDILTKVNDGVSQMSDPNSSRRQMPQPASSLRMRVVFPIPKDPAPSLSTSL